MLTALLLSHILRALQCEKMKKNITLPASKLDPNSLTNIGGTWNT